VGLLPAGSAGAETLSLATGNPSGVFYPLGGGIASVWNRHVLGFRIRAEVTAASIANLIQVAKGESAAALTMGDAMADAVEGRGRFPHPLPVVALARLYPNLLHVVSVEGSGIRRIEDLRGRRVSLGAAGSGTALAARNLLAVLGIAERELDARRLNFAETSAALRDGSIDAGFIAAGVGNAAVTELGLSRELVLVGLSEDELRRLSERHPAYAPFTLPGGVYPGVDEATRIASIWCLLVVHADMDAALAERLVAALFEHRSDLLRVAKVVRFLTPESALDTGRLPMHPGARRYLVRTSAPP
jgi:TRAP transporter TAXI family solute receptor